MDNKVKKGYIVSWFNAGRNYGQTLQAYALQRVLKDMGYDCMHICFGENIEPYITRRNIGFRLKVLSRWQRVIQNKFDRFVRSHMKTTPYFGSVGEINKYICKRSVDFLICGSDQIWNPYSVDPLYYLHGIGDKDTLKIAYAVSTCDEKRKHKFYEYPQIESWIKELDYIYTREESGKRIFKDLFGIESQVVLDPTLLLSGNQWVRYMKLRKNKETFVLCYGFNLTSEQKERIEQYAADYDCSVKYGNVLKCEREMSKKDLWSPIDFLENIYNAKMVYTDSFHGMVFSILFHKEFLVFDNGDYEDSDEYYNIDRMMTILRILGLTDRIWDNTEKPMNRIDYDSIDIILDQYRKKSISILKTALK